MKKIIRKLSGNRGFTIVEFMLATLIFSIVLLAITGSILHITKIYQRSVNESRTQAAARNLVDTVAQTLQFSKADSAITAADLGPTLTRSFCFGGKQILYVLGREMSTQLGSTKSRNVAVLRPASSCVPSSIILGGVITTGPNVKELLNKGMRLSKFTITENGSMVTVTARVAYGSDEVFCDESNLSTCNSSAVMSGVATTPNLICKSYRRTAAQFCAVSEISATVQRRL